MSELEIEAALRQLVDMVRRMDPDYVDAHGLEQTSDEEYDSALQRAEDVLDFLDEQQQVEVVLDILEARP
jgi:uncharacterized UPF0160 family protein